MKLVSTVKESNLVTLFSGELNTLGEVVKNDDSMYIFERFLLDAFAALMLPKMKDFEFDFAEFKDLPKDSQTLALQLISSAYYSLHLRNILVDKTLMFFDSHPILKAFLKKGFVVNSPTETTLEFIALNLAKVANLKLSNVLTSIKKDDTNKHTLMVIKTMEAINETLNEQSEIELMDDEEIKISEALEEIYNLSLNIIPTQLSLIKKTSPLLSIVSFTKNAEEFEQGLNKGLLHIRQVIA